MRKLIFNFILLLVLPAWSAAQLYDRRLEISDVLHYRFKLEVNDKDNSIKGDARLTVRALEPIMEIAFDLNQKNASGKGMTVSRVEQKGRPLAFRQQNNLLSITVSAKAGDTLNISIFYGGIPADGLIIARNKYGHRTMFADNWPNRAHNWIPCVDNPADKASVEFIVNAPAHYQVISNGIQVGEALSGNNTKTTHWKETVPLPVKVMVIGVARFAIELAGVADGTPVYSWVYPEDRIKGFYDYALAREIIPWFNKTIAPYPFRKLASVQSTTMFGGMENASAVFYSENSIRGNRSNEALLTHEIAHQWFGNSATESSWQHVWLSEGFATYLTHMYLEDKYGNDSLLKRMRADRKEVLAFGIRKPGSVIDTSVRSNFITLLNTDTYQKGGWILHMLRNLIGEENFRKGIRQYYATYKGKNASTEDFQKVMQSLTKHDLGVFFKQWLYTPGNPDLQVSYTYDQNQKEVIVEIVQLQETVFTFPLDIEIVTSTKKIPGTYMVKGKKTILRVHSDQEPDRLILDPGVRLLFSEVKNQ